MNNLNDNNINLIDTEEETGAIDVGNPLRNHLSREISNKSWELTTKKLECKKIKYEICLLEQKLDELYEKDDLLDYQIDNLKADIELINKLLNSKEIEVFKNMEVQDNGTK